MKNLKGVIFMANGTAYIPLIVIACIVFFFFKKRKKSIEALGVKEQNILEDLASNPTDEKVNAFMHYLNTDGGGRFANKPKNWNSIRGLWFVVHESPNVTTSVKKQFRDWLMLKGLRIVGNDKDIIDNYGK